MSKGRVVDLRAKVLSDKLRGLEQSRLQPQLVPG